MNSALIWSSKSLVDKVETTQIRVTDQLQANLAWLSTFEDRERQLSIQDIETIVQSPHHDPSLKKRTLGKRI